MKPKVMKRYLLIAIALLAMSVSGLAESFTYKGYTYSVNPQQGFGLPSVTVTGCQGSPDEIIIPDIVFNDGSPFMVTVVGQGAFSSFRGSKVVIGDEVTTIEGKAFEHFAENRSDCVLILGKSVTSISAQAFEHFGEHGTNNLVLLNCFEVPLIDKQTFAHVKNTTFYVRDEATYEDYRSANVWSSYGEASDRKNIKYTWPFPYKLEAFGGWITAVFPVDLSEAEIECYFGEQALVAYLESAQYDAEKNEYQLHFEYATTIKANTPYLLSIGKENEDFVSEVEGNPFASTLTKSVPISNKDGYQAQMVGVYSTYVLSENEFYLRNADDKLYFYIASGDGNSFVNANKCYFKILDQAGHVTAAKVACLFDGGGTTAIRLVETPRNRDAKKGIYRLDGRYLGEDASNLPKGIYIVNGKKMIVR